MIDDTSFKNWKIVEDEQEWEDYGKIKWDPDSSPAAWKHYQKYYSTVNWDFLNNYVCGGVFAAIDNLFFYDDKKEYYEKPCKEYEALFSPQIKVNCESNKCGSEKRESASDQKLNICCKRKKDEKRLRLRLRGETDFHFDVKKYIAFVKTIVNDDKANDDEKYNAVKLLNKCNDMHHSLLNFSLMQSVGNMQKVKSRGLYLESKGYEWLDRLDTFVYHLDMYYKNKKDDCNKDDSVILSCAGDCKYGNKECLKDYLDKFGHNPNDKDAVYDYCDKIYFIKEKDFIDSLIESGKKALNTCDDVVRYMKLAIGFWERKQKYFEKQNTKTDN